MNLSSIANVFGTLLLVTGSFWDQQNILLDDIKRIEVIRGPGGTLWGANAVNGVINVITKRAEETQGVMLFAGGRQSGKSHVCSSYWR